jgi:hypothetical protein
MYYTWLTITLLIFSFERNLLAQDIVPFQADNGLFGFQNQLTGEVTITPKYALVKEFTEGFAAVMNKENKWGFINTTGREIVPFVYDGVLPFKEKYAAVCKGCKSDANKLYFHGGKWGYINDLGQLIIQYKFNEVGSFSEGLAPVCIGCSQEMITNSSDGHTFGIAYKDGNFGYINPAGELVIDFKYTSAAEFSQGLALVSIGQHFSYINTQGKIVSSHHYEFGETIYQSIARVKRNGKYGIINDRGTEVLPAEYDLIGNFEDGLAIVCKGCTEINFEKGKYGVISNTGKLLVPADFKKIKNFSTELIKVYTIDGKEGFVNKYNSDEPIIYDEADDFPTNGFALTRIGKKYGYIDETGSIIMPPKYDRAEEFRDGVAKVYIQNDLYFLTSEGKEITIKKKYDSIGIFKEGFAPVAINGKWGYINQNADEVIPPDYEEVSVYGYSEGLVAVKKNNQWGFVDTTGAVRIPIQYDMVEQFKGGTALVTKNGQSYFLDREGNCMALCK